MHNVDLTGLAGACLPDDPEPELISIQLNNVAVAALQENNGVTLVDLVHKEVIKPFANGAADLKHVDAMEDGVIDQSLPLHDALRESDGATWINDHMFATADEGNLGGGSRGFAVWDDGREAAFTSGDALELLAAAISHYPEERSENKGNEPESIACRKHGGDECIFVNSERSNAIFIYGGKSAHEPAFKQALPAGPGPEGALATPSRGLCVAASEADSREDKTHLALNITNSKRVLQSIRLCSPWERAKTVLPLHSAPCLVLQRRHVSLTAA